MSSPFLPLLVGAFLSASALTAGTVIYQDQFEHGDGVSPVAPHTALNWFGYSSGNAVMIQRKALVNIPGINPFRGVIGVLSAPITLKTGESLRVDFQVTLSGANTLTSDLRGVRFGLLYSRGTPGSALGDKAFNTSEGYFTRIAYQAPVRPYLIFTDIVKETGASTDGPLGGVDTVVLPGGSGLMTSVLDADPRKFGFMVTRVSETAVRIDLFEDEDATPFYSLTDKSDTYFTFDEVAIGSGAVVRTLSIDNVTISHHQTGEDGDVLESKKSGITN